MASSKHTRCPTCKDPVPAASAERTGDFPFCSERCRLLDLHEWLTGGFRIPLEDPAGEQA